MTNPTRHNIQKGSKSQSRRKIKFWKQQGKISTACDTCLIWVKIDLSENITGQQNGMTFLKCLEKRSDK